MNTVTQEQVDSIFAHSHFVTNTLFDKCTLVVCKLPNGFVIVESSACVDPANYDHNTGLKICYERIKNKIWELEGYALQKEIN
jgi:hypothetical protein